MIYMTTISNQLRQFRPQSDKLDLMVHSINFEGTRKMQLFNYPD